MLFSFDDLRQAVRGLGRARTISVAALLCLGLGIGATTAIFSAVSTALLRALPFGSPEQLVTVYRTTAHFDTGPFSAPNYTDLAAGTRSLAGLAAVGTAPMLLATGDETVQVAGCRVTGNLFPVLRLDARHGRLLGPADDVAGAPDVVVIGEELWRSRFNADPALVGRTIEVEGRAHEVVGIAPAGLRIPRSSSVVSAAIWVPMRFTEGEMASRGSNWLRALGRLAPTASVASANAELRTLMAGIVAAHPELDGEQVRLVAMPAESVRTVRGPLLLLLGAVSLVLLIACANVASLLLVRGMQRRREMAVRAALGGGRWGVVRPVLAEGLVLTVGGLALGLGLAWVGVRAIAALAAAQVPQLHGLAIDGRVLGFALALAVLVALVCASVPALRAAATEPQEALRSGTGVAPARQHRRLLGAVVIGELALSLMLLLGAGLVLRSFLGLVGRDPGFETTRLLTLEATVSPLAYPDQAAAERFLAPALERIAGVSGVEAVGAISLVPYQDWGSNFTIRYEGQPDADRARLPLVEIRMVTPDIYRVTGQRLLAGRLLDIADGTRAGAPAVVVANEALVRRDFPGLSPADVVGRRFDTGGGAPISIVGVVSDIRNFGPVEAPRPEVDCTYAEGDAGASSFPILVRTAGDPRAVTAEVLAALRQVDPRVAVSNVQTMPEVIAKSLGRPRFYLALLGVFAVVALLLAVAGLFGVMSYAVAQRSLEIGIRSALGATPAQTARLVLGEGAVLVAAGLGLGLLGGLWATRLLRALLYGTSPSDPLTALAVAVLLALAGLVALAVPALRAVRLDPLAAMRAE